MDKSRIVFAGISIAILARLIFVQGMEAAAAGVGLILLAGSMVWFSDFWARHILTYGLMPFFATDFKKAERSGAAVEFLGWVILILFGFLVFS